MKSWQVIQWGQPLQLREYTTPKPTGTQVLVRITSSGMCHSDLHIISGGFDMGDGVQARLEDRGVHTPYTPGHEMLGTVEALGPDADGVDIGDSRIVFPWIGCGSCQDCQAGDENYCLNARFLGARVDGGYSDYVVVPHAKYLLDYGKVSEALACTYACSGITAWTALTRMGELTKNDTLLLIGLGGVGYNGLYLAPHLSDARMGADIDDKRREAAVASGAAEAIDPRAPGALDDLHKMTNGRIRAAIDFVGSPDTFQFGMDAIQKNGTLVMVGLFGGSHKIALPMFPFTAMSIRGSYVGNLRDMDAMMQVIKTGAVPSIPIEERPIDTVNASLRELEGGQFTGRIVLKP